MNKPTDELKLCTKCIGNKRFEEWIQNHGKRGKCEFDKSHGSANKVVSVAEFAVVVDDYFRETYQLGGEQSYVSDESDNVFYGQRGESYRDILANDLECDDDLLSAVADNLPDATHHDIMQGGESFYDEFSSYESIAEARKREQAEEDDYWYQYRFSLQWKDFCEKVQYERRFFGIKKLLDDLFGNPDEYESGKINPIYLLNAGQKLHRARLIDGGFTEEQLRAGPAKELGAPPPEKTTAGRMNVEFIPVFYASFSEEGAISEIRPGIGEDIAVGEFVLARPLKVFDFTAFSRAEHEQWKDCYAHTRYEFISQMEDEISRQVRPFEKQKEYIATQIVAEYLKEHFSCDAVIYRSSMMKGNSTENRNIVVLPRRANFVTGDDAVLEFVRFDVKQIENVVYEIADIRF